MAMSLPIALFALIGPVASECLGKKPVVFQDIHDGDMKQMARSPSSASDFTIKPFGNNQSWVIHGTFDKNCVASVDFNVPGKPNPPPVNLQATVWIMTSIATVATKLGVEFTDPTGTLAPSTQPLNLWFSESVAADATLPPAINTTLLRTYRSIGARSVAPRSARQEDECISTGTSGLVFDDIHDGDMKILSVQRDALVIKPHGNDEKWVIHSTFNSYCVATIDFNVPGKPNPPPVDLQAAVWGMLSIAGLDKTAIVFTDPSSTIAPSSKPLNVWVPGN